MQFRIPALVSRSFSTRKLAQKAKTDTREPLITCKRPEFNTYKIQAHAKFNSIPLASEAWRNRKSKGDFFIINPQKTEYYSEDEWGRSFADFEIQPELVENLRSEGLSRSTWVQNKALPGLLQNNHALIAAETGCGKTLAYLVPIVSRMLRTKKTIEEREFNSPLVLILTPGRELAEQIEEVARSLTKGLDVNIKTLLGGNAKQHILHPSFEDIDILIGSMGVISKLTTNQILRMHHCRHVVLDEADTLLDESFSDKLTYFLRRFPFHKNHLLDLNPSIVGTQLVLASATLPTNVDEMLQSVLNPETISRITSPNLHRLLSHVPQKFLRTNKSDRPLHVLQIARAEVAKRHSMIVFSNKSEASDFLSIFLNSNGVECLNLNGDMANKMRLGRFKEFQEGRVPVLSTTDVASRGLNTVKVHHVVNFDFPLYAADYIHRCGRTGRVGQTAEGCQITNLISSAREIGLVNRIEHAARTGNELPNVDANIKGILVKRSMAKNEAEK